MMSELLLEPDAVDDQDVNGNLDSEDEPNVLLVDDNPNNLLALRGMLQGEDAHFPTAGSGAAALRWLSKHEAAAILLDVSMPGLDGFETAKLIRLRPRSQFTPILFVTAVAQGDLQQKQGYHLGAVDYLLKPLEPEIVCAKVAVFIEMFQQRRKLVRALVEVERAERELKALNAELDSRVQARTAQLEASNKALESFAYSVSHDLRAPLRAIDGFAQMLGKELGDSLEPKPRHHLEVICESVQQMGRLIDDLLRFSRLGRQPLAKETVDPGDLVQQCLKELTAEQEGRKVELTVGALPSCEADRALLKQVWLNLLSNALKFTRKRNPAQIAIGCDEKDGRRVYYVRDNGCGFDMQYSDKLFGVFQRLHRQEDYEGTGIGLALVQRILLRHGGSIWPDAKPDEGATFYFTLN